MASSNPDEEATLAKICCLKISESHPDLEQVKRLLASDFKNGQRQSDRNKKLNELFIKACRDGHNDLVQVLLSNSINFDASDLTNKPALQISCKNGHLKIVELLLDWGFHVNSRDLNHRTPLMWACVNLEEKIVALLLERGANTNAKDQKGRNALMLSFDHEKKSEKSLHHYVCLKSQKTKTSNTIRGAKSTIPICPVCACYSCRHVRIVEQLIHHGTDVNAKLFNGQTALEMYACGHGNATIVELLLKKGGRIISSIGCIKAWIDGFKNSRKARGIDERILKLLLQYGADINEKEIFGNSIFMQLCGYGNSRFSKILLRHGADINASSTVGETGLICACRANINNEKLLEALVQHGADINARDNKGRSPLMHAVSKDKELYVSTLLAAGANPDLIDNDKYTVFSYALKGNGKCLKVLLDDGRLWTQAQLKPLHQYANNSDASRLALLETIKYGIFQWEWCPPVSCLNLNHGFVSILLDTLNAGLCPGLFKVSEGITAVSPLYFSFLVNDRETTEKFISSLYYYPEEFTRLSSDRDLREYTELKTLLHKFTSQPPSLLMWSFLTVSKAISLAGLPGQRSQRVDALLIPQKFKNILMFKTD